MSEYEDLVAKILEQKADLNRESLNELVKEKKATVGKGYLQDKGALYLIATDLGISLGEPSNDGISIKDIFSGAKDVSLETRVLNVAKPRQFSRKDGSEFLLRTMTVYDNGGTVSVKLWDEKANLPGIENLKPGDLVRIVKAYVKSDLSGAPTINIGSGSSIEPSDSQSDIRGIDSMSVDVGTIKQHEDKDLVVTGAVDGPIGTINFTNLIVPGKASSLVENFGATALTVLSGYGIGPDTAARILRNMVDENGDGLYRQIYEAERQYVMTRGFWND